MIVFAFLIIDKELLIMVKFLQEKGNKNMKLNRLIIFHALLSVLVLHSCQNTITKQPHKEAINNVLKKGFGVSRYNDKTEASGNKINSLNGGWYYNWGIDNPSDDYINLEYVPMIWGKTSINQTSLNKIKNGYQEGKYKYLLTFNEPDNNSQSNMTVDEAIALWPQLESLGIPLSSPCPADYSSGWLDQFMQKAKELNYRVDFIAIHCYQDFSISGIEKKMKTEVLDVIYEKYKLPIWLTEYGAIDISTWAGGGRFNPNCTEKAAKEYIDKATTMLESLGYIERYAWFVDNFKEKGDARPKEAPYTSLFNDDDTISSTGEIYRDIDSSTPLYIETKYLDDAVKNQNYSMQITASGGKGDYSFSCSNLPKGLNISLDGIISGKPTIGGEFNLKIICIDDKNQSTYKNFLLTII